MTRPEPIISQPNEPKPQDFVFEATFLSGHCTFLAIH